MEKCIVCDDKLDEDNKVEGLDICASCNATEQDCYNLYGDDSYEEGRHALEVCSQLGL